MKQLALSEQERFHIIGALLAVSLITCDKTIVGTLRRLAHKIIKSMKPER